MGNGSILNSNVADAFSVEALACLQSLTFVKEMGFSQVVVEGDSRMTIMKARRGVTDRSVIGIFIEDIRTMAFNFIAIFFQHVDRDSNIVAHTIAKNGFKLGNSQFWVEVPHKAAEMVDKDRWSLQLPEGT